MVNADQGFDGTLSQPGPGENRLHHQGAGYQTAQRDSGEGEAALQWNDSAFHPPVLQLQEPYGRDHLEAAFACCSGVEE